MLNERLVAHNIAPVTAASYQDRNLDVIPTIHTGRDPLTAAKRSTNHDINDRNQRVFNQRMDTLERLATQADRTAAITDRTTRIKKQLTDYDRKSASATDKRVTDSERCTATSEQRLTNPTRPAAPNPFDDAFTTSVSQREQAAAELIEQASRFDQAAERAARVTRKVLVPEFTYSRPRF